MKGPRKGKARCGGPRALVVSGPAGRPEEAVSRVLNPRPTGGRPTDRSLTLRALDKGIERKRHELAMLEGARQLLVEADRG